MGRNQRALVRQRDSLAIELYSPDVAYQKLDYIHLNPMTNNWNLVVDPCDYVYSSAAYYDRGDVRFEFLKPGLCDRFRYEIQKNKESVSYG
ncbi:MAG: hypothetical protein GY816_09715 [Cytophagales bacterium]|nr:hypothetical protein [Cytophagales bacterium]